jgi:hypothetical protein
MMQRRGRDLTGRRFGRLYLAAYAITLFRGSGEPCDIDTQANKHADWILANVKDHEIERQKKRRSEKQKETKR